MSHELTGIYKYFGELPMSQALYFVAPFALLLLSIAVFPLAFGHFWEKNRNKAIVSVIFGLPSAVFFLYKDWNILAQTTLEYLTFICLLGALFVISGGIYVRGSFKETPAINTAFLGIGAILANLIGTTGASMLLIRPLIRANQNRHHNVHTIIFFIFIISNCGGLLTPLGDPPLFLGFLKGVPFQWTLSLLPQYSFVIGSLLVIYFLIDKKYFKREPKKVQKEILGETAALSERFGIEGRRNFIYLAMVIAVSLVGGCVLYPTKGPAVCNQPFGVVLSESVQIICYFTLALLSYRFTPKRVHQRNHFQFAPIIEVAVIFAGIFASMIPALIILETKGGSWGIQHQWQFFWLSGSLSSFLDNAPTYLTFTSLAKGTLAITGEGLHALVMDPVGQKLLTAVSCGAVFMGANTYIGNGPNFMVKAIAEQNKIKMPSFFGYMLWSVSVLIPIFIAVTFIFFSPFRSH